MAEYVAKAEYVAVTIGEAGGNGVVQFVAAGGPIPEGVDQSILDNFLERGLIERKPAEPEPEAKAEVEPDAGDTPAAKMTVGELREYAAEHDIDLGDATRKDDILAAIAAAQA